VYESKFDNLNFEDINLRNYHKIIMNQKRDIDNRMQLTREKSNNDKSNANYNSGNINNNALMNTNSNNQLLKTNNYNHGK